MNYLHLRRTMMSNQHINTKIPFIILITLLSSSIMLMNQAAYAMPPEEACQMPRYTTWKEMQTERLWKPDEETLAAERSGKVFKYYCFTREDINRFYDTHADRIENTHFYPILEDDSNSNMLASVDVDDDCD